VPPPCWEQLPSTPGLARPQQRLSLPRAGHGTEQQLAKVLQPKEAKWRARARRGDPQARSRKPALVLHPQARPPALPGADASPRARLSGEQSHLRAAGVFFERLKLLFLHLAAQCQPQFMLFVHVLRGH